jgi:hypothetical protein
MTKLRNFSTEWKEEVAESSQVSQVISNSTKTKWQRKVMSLSNTPSQLNFNGLEIGKTYRLSFIVIFTGCAVGADLRFTASFGTDGILYADDNVGGGEYRFYFEKTFVADASTVVFTEGSGGTRTLAVGTWSYLEELPNHEITTQWT